MTTISPDATLARFTYQPTFSKGTTTELVAKATPFLFTDSDDAAGLSKDLSVDVSTATGPIEAAIAAASHLSADRLETGVNQAFAVLKGATATDWSIVGLGSLIGPSGQDPKATDPISGPTSPKGYHRWDTARLGGGAYNVAVDRVDPSVAAIVEVGISNGRVDVDHPLVRRFGNAG
jgi:hypothetical protein